MPRWLLAGCLSLCWAASASAQEGLWEVYHEAGVRALMRGYSGDAEKLWKQALEAADRGGPIAPETETLERLAALYLDQGRKDEAEAVLKRALAVTEKAVGPNSPAVAVCCERLAELYLGKRDEVAEPLLRRAIDIRTPNADLSVVYGPGVALYSCLLFQDKLAEAEKVIQWCLEVVDKSNDRGQATARSACLHGLALVRYKRCQDTEAAAAYREALTHLQKAFGPGAPELMWTLLRAGDFYYRLLGQPKEAEPFYRQAVEIAERAGGASPGQRAQLLLSLGEVCHALGHEAEAATYYDRCSASCDKFHPTVPAEKITVADLFLKLAHFRDDQGRHAEAEALCKRALDLVEQDTVGGDKELGRCYSGLADCYLAQKKTAAEAETFARRALETDEKCYGGNHGYVALDLARMARVARARNQDTEAEQFCKQAMAIGEKEPGLSRRADLREVVNEYMALLHKLNRAEDVKQLEAKATQLHLPPAPRPVDR